MKDKIDWREKRRDGKGRREGGRERNEGIVKEKDTRLE